MLSKSQLFAAHMQLELHDTHALVAQLEEDLSESQALAEQLDEDLAAQSDEMNAANGIIRSLESDAEQHDAERIRYLLLRPLHSCTLSEDHLAGYAH